MYNESTLWPWRSSGNPEGLMTRTTRTCGYSVTEKCTVLIKQYIAVVCTWMLLDVYLYKTACPIRHVHSIYLPSPALDTQSPALQLLPAAQRRSVTRHPVTRPWTSTGCAETVGHSTPSHPPLNFYRLRRDGRSLDTQSPALEFYRLPRDGRSLDSQSPALELLPAAQRRSVTRHPVTRPWTSTGCAETVGHSTPSHPPWTSTGCAETVGHSTPSHSTPSHPPLNFYRLRRDGRSLNTQSPALELLPAAQRRSVTRHPVTRHPVTRPWTSIGCAETVGHSTPSHPPLNFYLLRRDGRSLDTQSPALELLPAAQRRSVTQHPVTRAWTSTGCAETVGHSTPSHPPLNFYRLRRDGRSLNTQSPALELLPAAQRRSVTRYPVTRPWTSTGCAETVGHSTPSHPPLNFYRLRRDGRSLDTQSPALELLSAAQRRSVTQRSRNSSSTREATQAWPSRSTPRRSRSNTQSNRVIGILKTSAQSLHTSDKARSIGQTRAGRRSGLFITRLHPDTSERELDAYIWKAANLLIHSEKLNAKFKSYASFHVTLARGSWDYLPDAAVWPQGVLIKEFK